MRRNQVIYNRKLSHNIKGWPGYHISKRGRLYKYYPKRGLWMFMKGLSIGLFFTPTIRKIPYNSCT